MRVIFIHGPAASGKYSIALELKAITKLPSFHNHLTVDLATNLHEFGSAEFIRLREEIWISAFKSASRADQSFIFTFHPEKTVDPALIKKLQSIVEESGGQVHYIQLACSEITVLQRLNSPSRAKFGKLQDREHYLQLAADGCFKFPPLPAELIIDTEACEPKEAAAQINKLCGVRS